MNQIVKSWGLESVSDIAFKFSEMIQEVQTFEAVAKKFLDESASDVLAEYLKQLQFIQSTKSNRGFSWGISRHRPLRTAISKGSYEGGTRRGGMNVFATISTQWEISCPNEKSKKIVPQKHFHLTGLSSTSVKFFSIRDKGEEELLSVWQADIGDAVSPGCHFHIQVQREDEQTPYPRTFPVPRFPSLLTSPLAVAEFAISELFQSEWNFTASTHSSDLIKWSKIQRERMEKLLGWQQNLVKNSSGSPWTFLKGQKPDLELFV
jgi:hypothetical protein